MLDDGYRRALGRDNQDPRADIRSFADVQPAGLRRDGRPGAGRRGRRSGGQRRIAGGKVTGHDVAVHAHVAHVAPGAALGEQFNPRIARNDHHHAGGGAGVFAHVQSAAAGADISVAEDADGRGGRRGRRRRGGGVAEGEIGGHDVAEHAVIAHVGPRRAVGVNLHLRVVGDGRDDVRGGIRRVAHVQSAAVVGVDAGVALQNQTGLLRGRDGIEDEIHRHHIADQAVIAYLRPSVAVGENLHAGIVGDGRDAAGRGAGVFAQVQAAAVGGPHIAVAPPGLTGRRERGHGQTRGQRGLQDVAGIRGRSARIAHARPAAGVFQHVHDGVFRNVTDKFGRGARRFVKRAVRRGHGRLRNHGFGGLGRDERNVRVRGRRGRRRGSGSERLLLRGEERVQFRLAHERNALGAHEAPLAGNLYLHAHPEIAVGGDIARFAVVADQYVLINRGHGRGFAGTGIERAAAGQQIAVIAGSGFARGHGLRHNRGGRGRRGYPSRAGADRDAGTGAGIQGRAGAARDDGLDAGIRSRAGADRYARFSAGIRSCAGTDRDDGLSAGIQHFRARADGDKRRVVRHYRHRAENHRERKQRCK